MISTRVKAGFILLGIVCLSQNVLADDGKPSDFKGSASVGGMAGNVESSTDGTTTSNNRRSGVTANVNIDPGLKGLKISEPRKTNDGYDVNWYALANPSARVQLDFAAQGMSGDNAQLRFGEVGVRRISENPNNRWVATILPMSAVVQSNNATDVKKSGVDAGLFDLNYTTSMTGGPLGSGLDFCLGFKMAHMVLGQSRIQGADRIDPRTGAYLCLDANMGDAGRIKLGASAEGTINGALMHYGPADTIAATQTLSAGARYSHNIGSVPVFVDYTFTNESSMKDVPNDTFMGTTTVNNVNTHYLSVGVGAF
jgi:hypothetical protein